MTQSQTIGQKIDHSAFLETHREFYSMQEWANAVRPLQIVWSWGARAFGASSSAVEIASTLRPGRGVIAMAKRLIWHRSGRARSMYSALTRTHTFRISRLGAKWQRARWQLKRDGVGYGVDFDRFKDAKARAQGWADSDV